MKDILLPVAHVFALVMMVFAVTMLAPAGMAVWELDPALWSAAIGVLALAVPLASGVVFGEIIPQGDTARLEWLLVALVAVSVAGLPLQVAFAASVTRVEASVSPETPTS